MVTRIIILCACLIGPGCTYNRNAPLIERSAPLIEIRDNTTTVPVTAIP